MTKLNKWLHKRNEDGFINKEHEKLEKYLMIGTGFIIIVTFFSLVAWVLKEAYNKKLASESIWCYFFCFLLL